jgi:hypothetical protein
VIFQHTFEDVLSGKKTQTRRLMQPDDQLLTFEHPDNPAYGKPFVWDLYSARVRYEWGNTYAVQPARTKKGIARIRIMGIRQEDVRCISEQDAIAEALYNPFEFLEVWTHMHDKPAWNAQNKTDFSDGDESGRIGHCAAWMSWLKGTRPAERYQAWVLTFELVKEGE